MHKKKIELRISLCGDGANLQLGLEGPYIRMGRVLTLYSLVEVLCELDGNCLSIPHWITRCCRLLTLLTIVCCWGIVWATTAVISRPSTLPPQLLSLEPPLLSVEPPPLLSVEVVVPLSSTIIG